MSFLKKEKKGSELPPPPPPPLKFDELESELGKIGISPAPQPPSQISAPQAMPEIPLIPAQDMVHEEAIAPAQRPPTQAPQRMIADKTIEIHEDLKPREKQATPVFVSAQDYATIQNGVQSIRSTLAESESTITRLGELKAQQDRILGDWKTTLLDVEKKLTYIDSVIFTGE
ncbi:hypothetical protein HY641_04625 [Candidatus Woesearchaeota archaeon]|nr:hypothetical protein [Candidatus Woesearchaeota archaeon]